MAQLSLTLPVFVASSSDVMPERQVVDEEIANIQREAAKKSLVLEPFRWEKDYYAASGEVQPGLNEHLRRAELAVFIMWGRLGPGVQEELQRALEQARLGETDNVAIYFKTIPPTKGDASKVQAVRSHLQGNNLALTWDFRSTEEFRQVFTDHLGKWVKHWDGIPACCKFALENCQTIKGTGHTGENRLARLIRTFDLALLGKIQGYLSKVAIGSYQSHGVEGARQPLDAKALRNLDQHWQLSAASLEDIQHSYAEAQRKGISFVSPKPLLHDNTGVWFADIEWFFYFCALGLAEAIQKNDVDTVIRRPNANPIHQYLSAHVRSKELNIVPTLLRWLTDRARILPVGRNFAAYVLGMIMAYEAQDELANSLRNDPGEDVGTYCITSLGKLRSRRYLRLLMDMYLHERDEKKRMLLSQAVCKIVGIEPYEL